MRLVHQMHNSEICWPKRGKTLRGHPATHRLLAMSAIRELAASPCTAASPRTRGALRKRNASVGQLLLLLGVRRRTHTPMSLLIVSRAIFDAGRRPAVRLLLPRGTRALVLPLLQQDLSPHRRRGRALARVADAAARRRAPARLAARPRWLASALLAMAPSRVVHVHAALPRRAWPHGARPPELRPPPARTLCRGSMSRALSPSARPAVSRACHACSLACAAC